MALKLRTILAMVLVFSFIVSSDVFAGVELPTDHPLAKTCRDSPREIRFGEFGNFVHRCHFPMVAQYRPLADSVNGG